ncbi:hypothetical protein FQN57_005632 [Myotisia sp. PD_48]|nr:hypothetical protein FQN57_005632 [Myotisia sp. PD_48]
MPAKGVQFNPIDPDTLITVKVAYEGTNRRFKLPIRDLGAYSFPQKIRELLSITPGVEILIERYSDSAGNYVKLESENHAVYKQLYRAAKAKLKLRISVSQVQPVPPPPPPPAYAVEEEPAINSPQEAPEEVKEPEIDLAQSVENYSDSVQHLPEPVPDYPLVVPEKETPKDEISPEHVATYSQMSAPSVNGPCMYNPSYTNAILVDCNYCGDSIANRHYHCSICEDGDYDLCQDCITAGVVCLGVDHWLIKRAIINGMVVNSTTEILPPKNEQRYVESTLPLAVAPKPAPAKPKISERVCNTCVKDWKVTRMVTCLACPDYDLCFNCLLSNTHGHHPGHRFSIIQESTDAPHDMVAVRLACQPGRVVSHAAVCDGCDKYIVGIRNKCLDCPDWDFCQRCMTLADESHPGHRFVPVYDRLQEQDPSSMLHYNVYCDGVLCAPKMGRSYITGTRYKCTVCHDTDFCANCEAHPHNTHNVTHPLIQLKTPVRHVSIATYGENYRGEPFERMGDRPDTKSTSTETVSLPPKSHAATQAQPEPAAPPKPISELPEPVVVQANNNSNLMADYVTKALRDGTSVLPDQVITQSWTLRNFGPEAWPKGCSVRFVGGDGMFNVDTSHPLSVSDLMAAMEAPVTQKPVQPGCSIQFNIDLKGPQRIGKAISYWRLKTADGVAFGPRLWCDIEVCPDIQTVVRNNLNRRASVPRTLANIGTNDNTITNANASAKITTPEATLQTSETDMVFPKLDKESPVSSVHEGSTQVVVKKEENGAKIQEIEDIHDLADDVESLVIDNDSSEAGFLTDEEYDILDASDQEFATAKASK